MRFLFSRVAKGACRSSRMLQPVTRLIKRVQRGNSAHRVAPVTHRCKITVPCDYDTAIACTNRPACLQCQNDIRIYIYTKDETFSGQVGLCHFYGHQKDKQRLQQQFLVQLYFKTGFSFTQIQCDEKRNVFRVIFCFKS